MFNEVASEGSVYPDAPVEALPESLADHAKARRSVVVLPGDGVGPDVTNACLRVLDAACPQLDWIRTDGGTEAKGKGSLTGLPKDTIDAIAKSGVVLKGPLAKPVGASGDGVDYLLRNIFELYGNVRPVKQLPYPGLPYAYSDIDMVVVRENGTASSEILEHMQTADVVQSLRLVSRKGSERIAQLGFALATAHGRKKVHCVTDADGPILAEGFFHSVFENVADEYPALDAQTIAIEECAQALLATPEKFDVIVSTNLHGSIVSDLATSLVGGFGLTAGAEIGRNAAMFAPLHGPAPLLAGQTKHNPTAMIMAGVMMLRHLGLVHQADCVEQAVRRVYQEGATLPEDIALPGHGAGTDAFGDAVIEQLEVVSPVFPRHPTKAFAPPAAKARRRAKSSRRLDGVDVFVEWRGTAEDLAARLEPFGDRNGFQLFMITNSGAQAYPHGNDLGDTTDHWLCRFRYGGKSGAAEDQVAPLLDRLSTAIRWMHVEKLTAFDGDPGYGQAKGAL